jgi:hypothetical protein
MNLLEKLVLFHFVWAKFSMFLFSIRHVLRSSSDLLRHSLIALLGGCGTAPAHSKPLESYPSFIQISHLLCRRAQYILAARLCRVPSKNDSGRLDPQCRCGHT